MHQSNRRVGIVLGLEDGNFLVKFGDGPVVRYPSSAVATEITQGDLVNLFDGVLVKFGGLNTSPKTRRMVFVSGPDSVKPTGAPEFIVKSRFFGSNPQRGKYGYIDGKSLNAFGGATFYDYPGQPVEDLSKPRSPRFVVVPDGTYFLEDGAQKSVPSWSLFDLVVVPPAVFIIKMDNPVPSIGCVVVPVSAWVVDVGFSGTKTLFRDQGTGSCYGYRFGAVTT